MAEEPTVFAAAQALIKRHEGCRLGAYPDPLTHDAPWTIGWGHTGADVAEGDLWTQAQCDQALATDLGRVIDELEGELPWLRGLDAPRVAVLIDMAYNMGVAGLMGFHHTLWLIETGRYAAAAIAMRDSDWAEQVASRAQEDADIIQTGVLPA